MIFNIGRILTDEIITELQNVFMLLGVRVSHKVNRHSKQRCLRFLPKKLPLYATASRAERAFGEHRPSILATLT